jgi:hypothetical protein
MECERIEAEEQRRRKGINRKAAMAQSSAGKMQDADLCVWDFPCATLRFLRATAVNVFPSASAVLLSNSITCLADIRL